MIEYFVTSGRSITVFRYK